MGNKTTIDYITTASLGSLEDFGDLRTQTHMGSKNLGAANNLTYGAYFGGYQGSSGGYSNDIEYISIASTGNTQAWGELDTNGYECGGGSNETRGIRFGGNGPASVVEFWAWASTGDAGSFGSMTAAAAPAFNAAASATRCVTAGGTDGSGKVDRMEFITVDTEATAETFGDLAEGNYDLSACSNGTRSEFWGGLIHYGGYPSRISTDRIQYITVDTESGATDQGNLTDEINSLASGQGSA